MAKKREIRTPRGVLYTVKTPHGKITCALRWNPAFKPQRDARFAGTQAYIDSTVLRVCAPYIPFVTGMLERSGPLGTVIGSGKVTWVAPYAKPLHDNPKLHFNRNAHPKAGADWFNRAMIDHKQEILRGAAAQAGGKPSGV